MNLNNKIDVTSVKNMYNEMPEIWPLDDKWYQYTYSQILKFLMRISSKYNFTDNMKILNAGSGGNTYNLPGIHYHVDIAEQKIKDIPNAFVGSIEDLCFTDNKFDVCICVGSVINYCDALVALSEMIRVLKSGGILILDFDQSHSFEFWGTSHFNKTADIVETFNSGYADKTWVYSPQYIFNILKKYNVHLSEIQRYHILSPLIYRITHNEDRAATFAKYDKCVSSIPFLKNFSCNIILCSQKI